MAKRGTTTKRPVGGTPAVEVLAQAGIPYTVHTYHRDPAATSFGLEAAAALGVEPERVFKTLLADVDGELVQGIVPVSAHLDLKSLAAVVRGKRAMPVRMPSPSRIVQAIAIHTVETPARAMPQATPAITITNPMTYRRKDINASQAEIPLRDTASRSPA